MRTENACFKIGPRKTEDRENRAKGDVRPRIAVPNFCCMRLEHSWEFFYGCFGHCLDMFKTILEFSRQLLGGCWPCAKLKKPHNNNNNYRGVLKTMSHARDWLRKTYEHTYSCIILKGFQDIFFYRICEADPSTAYGLVSSTGSAK